MRKFHILSSVALAFSLFFTLGTAATQAQDGSEFAGGNGTEENPWLISTKQQLAALDNYVGDAGKGKFFLLTQDLDFTDDFSRSGVFYNDGKFWEPIGNGWEESAFQGTFDGENHEIIGLRVNSENSGLFGCIQRATIKNLTVSYGKVKGDFGFGGISYYASDSVIENCHVKSDEDGIIAGRNYAPFGGLIGYVEAIQCYVIDSSFEGNLKSENDGAIGGILGTGTRGTLLVTIFNSFVEGDISSAGGQVGGMVGKGSVNIQNCHVKGNISTGGHAGGLIGSHVTDYYLEAFATIEKSYFQGNITGYIVGGLIGGGEVVYQKVISITSSYAEGKFQGKCIVGGLIGFIKGTHDAKKGHYISESYSKGEIEILQGQALYDRGNDDESGYLKAVPVSGGGLVGATFDNLQWDFVIENCYSHCDILVSSQNSVSVGGLVGCNYVDGAGDTSKIEIQNSYAMGSLKGDQSVQSSISGKHAYVGGLIGSPAQKAGNGNICHTFATVKKCVAMNPSLTAPHGDIEDTGRIGVFDNSNLTNNYALNTMTIKIKGKDVSVTGAANDKNGLAKTATELAQQSTYTGLGWNFNKIWKMSVHGYPIFKWQEDTPIATAPTITSQPKSQTVNVGDSVTFSVVVEGGSSSSNADFSTPLSNSVNLDMVWIEPGTFMMGSPEDELGRSDIENLHSVTLSNGFWMGKYEVTQAQYKAVMGNNVSYFSGDNRPAECVTWYNAMEFCANLTASEKAAGRLPEGYEYTLPTEAQWEYACRAGTTTAFNNGTNIPTEDQQRREPCLNLDPIAWYGWNYNDDSYSGTHPVGQKQPNAWGLYDMHGNVWEWCLDWVGDNYPTSAVTDPMGPSTGTTRVIRGGCWIDYAIYCRSAYSVRGGGIPDQGIYYNGFRVALVPVQAQASTAADTLTYQWYKDGVAISGATSSSYTIKSVKASDAGKYTVTVSNSVGSVTSDAATLTVKAVTVKPSITTQPKSQTVNEGNSATFSVTATGTAPLSYQWYKGSSKISGATSASYTISSAKTSDAGSYTVVVSNTAGSVTSSTVTLTVNGTTPVDPNGTAVRSVNRSGKSATVTLKLEPGEDVSVMFVEEHVPTGVTISVNNGGTYIASRNMIRWSFLDGNARDISYVLTVADDFDGKVSLSGEVTFDEATVTVTGTSEIDFAILTHPADMDNDFEISTKEIASYALAWTKGQNWSREPVDIPVTYVARAAIIWVNGGYYTYDSNKNEPGCWVSTNVKPASVEAAEASVNVRSINVLDGKAYVSVEVIPADGISVYFVEEQLPAGMKLNVTDISDGGKYVEARGLIRWSFLDAEPRTLTYTLEPEVGFSGVITLNGEVTFDEETFVTEGDTEANFGGGADVPVITAAYFGGMLIEGTIGGTYVIEYSEDGVNWTKADEITLTASSMYWADLTSANSPKRLYRAKVK